VHGVFTKNALQRIRKLGAQVISTNTVRNRVAQIDIAPLIAKAL
jgi:phosphoribosylpyrophosphate synthetase